MTFKNLHEAREWFRQYRKIPDSRNSEIPGFMTFMTNDIKLQFGEWMLFQHTMMKIELMDKSPHYSTMISRPILGIFVGFTVWDQALVVNIVEQPRAWLASHDTVTNPEIDYRMKFVEFDADVEQFPIWDEDVHVLERWQKKPTKKELREALTKKI